MLKKDVQIGGVYNAKVSGKLTAVRITEAHPAGGWFAKNVNTGRQVRIKTAGRLKQLPKKGDGDKPKRVRWQVFEVPPPGHKSKSIIHDFAVEEREAMLAKVKELKAKGKLEGEVWDCQNNELSRMFNFGDRR